MSENSKRAKAESGTTPGTKVRAVMGTVVRAYGIAARNVLHCPGMTFTFNRILGFAFCLLSVFCLPVEAQLGSNQSSGPLYSPRPELGQPANGLPSALKDIGIDQHLNQQLPLDLEFSDETGKTVKLAEYFHGKPVVLVLAYYNCPMLCTQVLNGLTGAMKGISFDAGREYEVLTVS
ncbi:MAG: hypothetical protein QOH96_2190, partial [Blastocatellia bacterium]|nr:hypothetical protein [Blastocatellia bacterium]